MYDVSATWNTIMSDPEHWFEVSVVIGEDGRLITKQGDAITFGGVAILIGQTGADSGYQESQIMSLSIDQRVFATEYPSVGACISQELTVTMLRPAGAIPRMALVRPYVRVRNTTQVAEWIPQGLFYIDTREYSQNDTGLNIMKLHCYDAMLMTERDFPDGVGTWPMVDTDVVSLVANELGVSVDQRTWDVMTEGYNISTPAGYTMREVLGNIAAMYCGNWVMTYDGNLLLVSLNSIPKETNYLVDNFGNTITFGATATHTDTASSVNFGGTISAISVDVQFKQPGAGNPTPSNVRPIYGYEECDINVSGDQRVISWQTQAGTIYGGVLNPLTGVLTVTWVGFDGGSVNWVKVSETTYASFYYIPPNDPAHISSEVCVFSSCYTGKSYNDAGDDGQAENFLFVTPGNRIQVKDSSKQSYTAAQIKTALTGQTFAYRLNSPKTYQLSPITVSEYSGTISASTGNITVTWDSEPVRILV